MSQYFFIYFVLCAKKPLRINIKDNYENDEILLKQPIQKITSIYDEITILKALDPTTSHYK